MKDDRILGLSLLGIISLIGIVVVGILAYETKDIPDGLWTVLATAVGALAGALKGVTGRIT